jgi:hypothetical protein
MKFTGTLSNQSEHFFFLIHKVYQLRVNSILRLLRIFFVNFARFLLRCHSTHIKRDLLKVAFHQKINYETI